ncbi:BQ2448_7064 [Microbotryum intermedium]|uniref:BQ2448_7064 protein n=1 Tax=Microbotryum intermedium TaxID=269621 RepID=A0A238FK14_9BASI|nr:BQ2448_7064 [Microbotryum intermedium]
MPSYDLLGPATATTIDPSAFARRAAHSLQAARIRQAELTSYIKERTSASVSVDIDIGSDVRQRLYDRCSAQDLKAHTSAMYSDDYLRSPLRALYEVAWLSPHNDADLRHLKIKSKSSLREKLHRIKRSRVAVVNAAETSQSSSFTSPARAHGNPASTATTSNTMAGDAASAPTADPRWSQWLEDHDANALRIARPIVRSSFLRAPGYSDLQTLTSLRPGKSARRQPTPPLNRQSTGARSSPTPSSLLSSLMYTIAFHPITPSLQPSPVNAITRAQTLRVLGTTTLAELKTNIIPSGSAVPEVEQSDGEDAMSSSIEQSQGGGFEEGEQHDEDSDEGEQSDGVRTMKRRKQRAERELVLALMMEPTEAARRIKWGKKRRETGSVFGIEGVLYADRSREVENYARPSTCSMIEKAISEIEWPAQKSVNGTAQPSIPTWSVGVGMEDVVLGSLPLRVGEPYYYLHDGNAEHIWTIEEIRLVHPLDPPPGPSVYPITSFLSRNRSLSRCYICDIDTATLITIDDELAGRSPALMCEKCFQLLHAIDQEWEHGDEEGQRKWRRIECVTEE